MDILAAGQDLREVGVNFLLDALILARVAVESNFHVSNSLSCLFVVVVVSAVKLTAQPFGQPVADIVFKLPDERRRQNQ